MTMTSVTVRVDDATKKQATDIVEDLGLDLSSVTRAFYRQIVRENRIRSVCRGNPFRLRPLMRSTRCARRRRHGDNLQSGGWQGTELPRNGTCARWVPKKKPWLEISNHGCSSIRCPRWDSNPHCTDFEAVSSTNWDTGAFAQLDHINTEK